MRDFVALALFPAPASCLARVCVGKVASDTFCRCHRSPRFILINAPDYCRFMGIHCEEQLFEHMYFIFVLFPFPHFPLLLPKLPHSPPPTPHSVRFLLSHSNPNEKHTENISEKPRARFSRPSFQLSIRICTLVSQSVVVYVVYLLSACIYLSLSCSIFFRGSELRAEGNDASLLRQQQWPSSLRHSGKSIESCWNIIHGT